MELAFFPLAFDCELLVLLGPFAQSLGPPLLELSLILPPEFLPPVGLQSQLGGFPLDGLHPLLKLHSEQLHLDLEQSDLFLQVAFQIVVCVCLHSLPHRLESLLDRRKGVLV